MKRTFMMLTYALCLAACDGETTPANDAGTNNDAGTTTDSGTTGPTARGANNPPTPGTQIDRAGRAAVSTGLIETFNGDSTAAGAGKDAYNAAGPAEWASFQNTMMGSMAILDALDEVCGNQLLADDTNPGGRYAALAGVLVDDQLYVNTGSGSCGVYLGLEGEIVGALNAGEGGCGGRTPNDDVIERTYSVFALGALAGFDDTIAGDSANHSLDQFPFLAAPR